METKFNLTIIDKNPEIKNFIYPGVSGSDIDRVKNDLKKQHAVIEFLYDEGEVLFFVSEIHSIVISDYLSAQEMDEPFEGDI